ncbi:MAG: cobalamin-dependent protein [Candidatus Eremiobacterota bacterium]
MLFDPAELRRAVVEGDVDRARALAREIVRAGEDVLCAIEHGFAAGIREVGRLWEEGEYFLPELVQGAEAMKAAMEVMNPLLAVASCSHARRGRVLIGTVEGDLHDIGKGLVGTLLAANGFEVVDLGVDVPTSVFLAKARETAAHIVAASALLTTTMTRQRALVEAVTSLPTRPDVLIGGAPTSPRWARELGAYHAENALGAVQVAETIMAARHAREA